MSATRAVVRGRIQELLGDVNPSERVVGQFRYDEVIARNMHLIAARTIQPQQTVGSVSLSASTYEYSVASTTAQTVALALLNSTGAELRFVPWDQFNAYYKQDTADPRASGTPEEYTLREDATNVLRLRFGPTPNATDSVKLHYSIIPALLTADSTSIPFANDLIRGLESQCAAEIVLMLAPDKLAALGLDRAAASKWVQETDRVIHDYNVRMRRLGTGQDRVLRYGGRRTRSVVA